MALFLSCYSTTLQVYNISAHFLFQSWLIVSVCFDSAHSPLVSFMQVIFEFRAAAVSSLVVSSSESCSRWCKPLSSFLPPLVVVMTADSTQPLRFDEARGWVQRSFGKSSRELLRLQPPLSDGLIRAHPELQHHLFNKQPTVFWTYDQAATCVASSLLVVYAFVFTSVSLGSLFNFTFCFRAVQTYFLAVSCHLCFILVSLCWAVL